MGRKKKTHCEHGHSIAVFGRTEWGRCRECKRLSYESARVDTTVKEVKHSEMLLSDGYNYVPPVGRCLKNVKISTEKQAELVARWEFQDATLEELATEFGMLISQIRYILFPNKRREHTQRWKKKNPEKTAEMQRRAIDKRRGGEGNGWGSLWPVVVTAWGNCCVYCGAEEPTTIDHLQPLSRGGTNHPQNLVPACHSCNSAKCATPLEDFVGPERAAEIREVADRLPDELSLTTQ